MSMNASMPEAVAGGYAAWELPYSYRSVDRLWVRRPAASALGYAPESHWCLQASGWLLTAVGLSVPTPHSPAYAAEHWTFEE